MFRGIFIAAMLAASPAAAEVIMHDDGGNVGAYLDRAQRTESVEFRGDCYSSCTLLLAVKEVCVARTAWFYFHMPRRTLPDGSYQVAWEFQGWVMAKYPEPVQELIEDRGGLQEDFLAISGSEMIDWAGFADCDEPVLPAPPKLWFE